MAASDKATPPVMAWALRSSDRVIVHVSALKVTGLACGCICACCGAVLEAVNADKPPEHFLKPDAQRKLFGHSAGSLRAGKGAAVVMSLIQPAKLNGRDPYAYLHDVLTRLTTHKNCNLDNLLPHRWSA